MSDIKNDLMNKLRDKEPSDMQIHKWSTAVQFEAAKHRRKISLSHMMQLAAAGVCGLIVGALLFGNFTSDNRENDNFASDNATIEVIYAKF